MKILKAISLLILAVSTGCASPLPKFSPPPIPKFSPLPAPHLRVVPQLVSPLLSTNLTLSVSRKVNTPPAVTLAWDAPVPLDPTISQYNIYVGVGSRVYTNVVNTTANSITISNLAFGTTYYFAATSYSASGLESDYTPEVLYATPNVPLPPGNWRITALFASTVTGPWLADTNWPAVTVSNPLGSMLWRLEASRLP